MDALTAERSLENYHLLPSVRGDLLKKLSRFAEARTEFERAASLTGNARERALLLERARAEVLTWERSAEGHVHAYTQALARHAVPDRACDLRAARTVRSRAPRRQRPAGTSRATNAGIRRRARSEVGQGVRRWRSRLPKQRRRGERELDKGGHFAAFKE